MPAMPPALAASAPPPEDFRNLRRVTRAILFLPDTLLFVSEVYAASVGADAAPDKVAPARGMPLIGVFRVKSGSGGVMCVSACSACLTHRRASVRSAAIFWSIQDAGHQPYCLVPQG